MRGDKGSQGGMGQGRVPMQAAMLLDIRQDLVFVLDVAGFKDLLEDRIDKIQHAIGAIRLFYPMLEGQREDRLNAGRTISDDTYGSGRRHGSAIRVAQLQAIFVAADLPVREDAALGGQSH